MTAKRNRWARPTALVVVLVTAGGLGVAAAKSDHWRDGDCGARHDSGHGAGMFTPGRHIDGKLAFLKAELKISEDQEPAWQAFAEVVRRSEQRRAEWQQAHRERRGSMRSEEAGAMPTLDERIDHGLATMRARMAAFEEIGVAAKEFYAQLDEAQQQLVDRMLPFRHGRRVGF